MPMWLHAGLAVLAFNLAFVAVLYVAEFVAGHRHHRTARDRHEVLHPTVMCGCGKMPLPNRHITMYAGTLKHRAGKCEDWQ